MIQPIAAFCVIWPDEFVCRVKGGSDVVDSESALALSRDELASAFRIAVGDTCDNDSHGECLVGAWRIERLPLHLQRPPFLVPGISKVTLPFRVDDELLGFAGLALPCRLSAAERAWYMGCCDALTACIAAPKRRVRPRLAQDQHKFRELSERELETARYLAEGYSVLNVASILGVSMNTVRTYVRRVYAKLDVCSRVQLAEKLNWTSAGSRPGDRELLCVSCRLEHPKLVEGLPR